MKIHIAYSTPIGEKCKKWAIKNLPKNTSLVEDPEDSDIFISVFYNKLVSADFIGRRKKCFNFHGGILPYYRGSGTITWNILNNETEGGISLHVIDEKIDHGPIIAIERFSITKNDTTLSLFKKAEKILFKMFKEWFYQLITGDYKAKKQILKKGKLYLRKHLEAEKDLTRYARAFHYPPKEQAYYLNKKGEKIYLKYE